MSDYVRYIPGARIGGTGTTTIPKGTFMQKEATATGAENAFIAAVDNSLALGVLDEDAKPGDAAAIAGWRSDVVEVLVAGANRNTATERRVGPDAEGKAEVKTTANDFVFGLANQVPTAEDQLIEVFVAPHFISS